MWENVYKPPNSATHAVLGRLHLQHNLLLSQLLVSEECFDPVLNGRMGHKELAKALDCL